MFRLKHINLNKQEHILTGYYYFSTVYLSISLFFKILRQKTLSLLIRLFYHLKTPVTSIFTQTSTFNLFEKNVEKEKSSLVWIHFDPDKTDKSNAFSKLCKAKGGRIIIRDSQHLMISLVNISASLQQAHYSKGFF